MTKSAKKVSVRKGYVGELRGLASNKYGGNQLRRERGFRGSRLSKPGKPRVYSEDEKRAYEAELRKRGDI